MKKTILSVLMLGLTATSALAAEQSLCGTVHINYGPPFAAVQPIYTLVVGNGLTTGSGSSRVTYILESANSDLLGSLYDSQPTCLSGSVSEVEGDKILFVTSIN